MGPSFYERLLHWGQGLVQGCLQGGAVAAKATCGIAVAHSVGAPIPELNWQQVLSAFVGAAVYHAFDYVSNNPIPGYEQEVTERTENNKGGVVAALAVVGLIVWAVGCVSAPKFEEVPGPSKFQALPIPTPASKPDGEERRTSNIQPTGKTNLIVFDNETGGWVTWYLDYANTMPPRWNYYASEATADSTIVVRAPATNAQQFYRASFLSH